MEVGPPHQTKGILNEEIEDLHCPKVQSYYPPMLKGQKRNVIFMIDMTTGEQYDTRKINVQPDAFNQEPITLADLAHIPLVIKQDHGNYIRRNIYQTLPQCKVLDRWSSPVWDQLPNELKYYIFRMVLNTYWYDNVRNCRDLYFMSYLAGLDFEVASRRMNACDICNVGNFIPYNRNKSSKVNTNPREKLIYAINEKNPLSSSPLIKGPMKNLKRMLEENYNTSDDD